MSAGRYVTAFDNHTVSKRTGVPASCMSEFLDARNDIRGETIQPRQVTSRNLASLGITLYTLMFHTN